MAEDWIVIEGARQNNLKGIDLRLPLNQLIVVTGVSGSGKSSLAFDTIYSEGQRRYVETFSAYTRQFLDRMDKPHVARIDGIPPAIAIDQTNPVRTSRSTVGTMTELTDHLKLLFARVASLYCSGCGRLVERDRPESICQRLFSQDTDMPVLGARLLITFPVRVPANFTLEEVKALLAAQGYHRIHAHQNDRLEVIQDRIRFGHENRSRLIEDFEAALTYGQGHVNVHCLNDEHKVVQVWRFSSGLHCPECDIHYRDPVPNHFSFNSPIGACETCRGFGRTIGIDYDLVVPDDSKTLGQGAVRPWQSASYQECQRDMMSFADRRGIPTDVAWRDLGDCQRAWVLEGEGEWDEGDWYGVKRFFDWLETKSYRMHIRVLLAKYRAYRMCPACGGARLRPEALLWRIGADGGLNIHDVMQLSLERCHEFFCRLSPEDVDEATTFLLGEIRSRLRYLVEVGLGYLALDRQSRTLSGGEVQRINLTTALGTSLVNALFVLDEPSIGLHARDIRRLVNILQRLRDSGNSLVVVEHDAEVIRAADMILDMGPGAGKRGGEVVFAGNLQQLSRCRASLTARYLFGGTAVKAPETALTGRPDGRRRLRILGVSEHNLKGIDIEIPLGRFVCISGVSGSGKSTLVEDVCYRGLKKLKHKPVEAPGRHRGIDGSEWIDDVVLVDQSPIGRTTRSNAASYVGAFDIIRKLFSAEPLARARGYTPGTFSFNSGMGRCPTCGGNGFEHIEMQFLSDVYIRCPDCDGTRYRADVLDVKLFRAAQTQSEALSIADVLSLTVDDACLFFEAEAALLRKLAPLQAVGLGYIALGQPVPTLSGGEAQRLKLAGHLARNHKGHVLFLFDEPTTGLHFDDIARLLGAFRQLVVHGHSLVVIEHNLDVIAAADWIIDLGPEGGDAGGELVCAGTLSRIMGCAASHTGVALKEHLVDRTDGPASDGPVTDSRTVDSRTVDSLPADGSILIRHAREHNLRNIDVRIPRDRFTVITGVSGSGKSTVAFDILFREGQRRYLESLNAYARQFVQPVARPDVDGVLGVPPTVAIEQRAGRGGWRSTVATMTEVYHYLRLFFAKLGTQYCPDCQVAIQPQTRESIVAKLLRDHKGQQVSILAPVVIGRKGYYTDLAKWAAKKGYPHLRVDGILTPTSNWPRLDRYKEHDIEVPVGVHVVRPKARSELRASIDRALELANDTLYVVSNADEGQRIVFSAERACPHCGRSFVELDPRMFSFNSKHGWCPECSGMAFRGENGTAQRICPACGGTRLRPEALAVRFRRLTLADITCQSVSEVRRLFASLKLRGREIEIARDIVAELDGRLRFLQQVGLSYLTLDRPAPTLSGGEAQRIRLAAQLGSNLRGVCYILDEPTIGLHARDNHLLLDTLRQLERKGNTIVVVEHDEETIRRAEHIVDLGPGGGMHGGQLVHQGSVADLLQNEDSVTGRLLREPLRHPIVEEAQRSHADCGGLEIHKASMHNLKQLNVRIPLGRLVCITGVSGSGKSTLIRDVLYGNLRKLVASRRARAAEAELQGCEGIVGWESIARVLEVDQSPIGKTPRSCTATYVGLWDEVRRLFAGVPEARMRGYGPSRFSFNVDEGRCEVCGGQGLKKIEMSFLPDVSVVCEACAGQRYTPETLAVLFKGKSIAEVLSMNVDEAARFFSFHPSIHPALQLLDDVGLGYLTLGQQSPTLSGGEAQRIKLVTELAKTKPTADPRGRQASVYVLDEPTIGLHMADVAKLIRVLHRLVAAGNTVVIVEHNLDVIAEADWIVDLGPEGGHDGGQIVAEGLPATIAEKQNGSHTARFLAPFLAARGRQGRPKGSLC